MSDARRPGTALRRASFVGGLVLVALLPVVGRWLRSGHGDRCSWDGVVAEARYAAHLQTADGREETLCCVCCLERRLATLSSPPMRVDVTDETSGARVDAAVAWYVDSVVATNRSTDCHVHAFASQADARAHAAAFHGTVRAGPGLAALADLLRRTR